MKNIVWAVLVLILAAVFVLEFRYTLVVNTPIVAKIDRLTGDVWIASSGRWMPVEHISKEASVPAAGPAQAAPKISKTQEKAK